MSESEKNDPKKNESENTEAEAKETEKLDAAEAGSPAEAPTEVQEADTEVREDAPAEGGEYADDSDAETGSGLVADRHRLKIIGASAVAILVAGALFLTPGNRLLGLSDSEAHSEDHHGMSDERNGGHGPEEMLPPGAEGGPEGGFHGMPGEGEFEHHEDGSEYEDHDSDDSGSGEEADEADGQDDDRGTDSQAPSGEQSYGQSGSAPQMETGQS